MRSEMNSKCASSVGLDTYLLFGCFFVYLLRYLLTIIYSRFSSKIPRSKDRTEVCSFNVTKLKFCSENDIYTK